MSPTETVGRTTAQPMRPRARLMLTIGLELISSETVALSELVKNAFDADAQFVLSESPDRPQLERSPPAQALLRVDRFNEEAADDTALTA